MIDLKVNVAGSGLTEATMSRPRLRFSLRTLFVALTIAGCLALILAWHFQKPKLYVVGKLSPSDVSAICHVIETTSRLREKRLLSITVVGPNEVEVETGEIRGPLDGGGQTATLKKTNGVWAVTDVGYWVS